MNVWLSGVRGGIAIVTSVMAVIMAAMSGIIGGEVVLLGLIALPQMLRLGYNQNLAIGTDLCFWLSRNYDTSVDRVDHLWLDYGNLDQGSIHAAHSSGIHVGHDVHTLHHRSYANESRACALARTET